jgi:hypothetical protein
MAVVEEIGIEAIGATGTIEAGITIGIIRTTETAIATGVTGTIEAGTTIGVMETIEVVSVIAAQTGAGAGAGEQMPLGARDTELSVSRLPR